MVHLRPFERANSLVWHRSIVFAYTRAFVDYLCVPYVSSSFLLFFFWLIFGVFANFFCTFIWLRNLSPLTIITTNQTHYRHLMLNTFCHFCSAALRCAWLCLFVSCGSGDPVDGVRQQRTSAVHVYDCNAANIFPLIVFDFYGRHLDENGIQIFKWAWQCENVFLVCVCQRQRETGSTGEAYGYNQCIWWKSGWIRIAFIFFRFLCTTLCVCVCHGHIWGHIIIRLKFVIRAVFVQKHHTRKSFVI